jgi:hypothetical protein
VDVTPPPTNITPPPVDVTPPPTNITPSPNITPPPVNAPPPPSADEILQQLIGEQNRILQEQAKKEEEAAKKAAEQQRREELKQVAQSGGIGFGGYQPRPAFEIDPLITGGKAEFTSPLDPFFGEVMENRAQAAQPTGQQGLPQTRLQGAPTPNYFNYGQSQNIEDVLGMNQFEKEARQFDNSFDLSFAPPPSGVPGMMQFRSGGIVPAYAQGGTRHGQNAHGALNVVHAAGKPRIDYRRGDAVTGMGDGQSDDIPAMLADGEYVLDSEIVSALGNGSTKAGSELLDKFREEIRKHKRGGPLHTIPPKSKSPLQYLEMAMKNSKKK